MADTTTRKELISLLADSSEFEHGAACDSLSAAYRAADPDERGRLTGEAVRRMTRLAQLGILTTAVGGTPHILRSAESPSGPPPYDEIARILHAMAEAELVICPTEGKAVVAAFGGSLTAVTDRESALATVAALGEDASRPAGLRTPAPVKDADPALAELFTDGYELMLTYLLRFLTPGEEAPEDVGTLLRISLRLMTSVLRPLGALLARDGAGPVFGAPTDVSLPSRMTSAWTVLDERLWELAKDATRIRRESAEPWVAEATAALQLLACEPTQVRTLEAPPHGNAPIAGSAEGRHVSAGAPRWVEARVAELTELQRGLPAGIEVSPDGPYLVTNAESVQDWLGREIPVKPQLALCRCGESGSKPFCDGSHVRVGFSGAKDPKRVPDRLDLYEGAEATVRDNRGLCAHSGFCTGGVPGAFRAGTEPFVDPDGAPAADIMRAVRQCPSGALGPREGEAVEGRAPVILVSRDGPYRVSGGVPLTGAGPLNEGASREHYSLCRCGHSQNKPFCSGMHWYVNFSDPPYSEDYDWTMFEWVGGFPALTRMTKLFYEKFVPQDPVVGPLFAHMAPDHPERVAAWLGEVFHGPSAYTDGYGGYSRMLSQHIGKGLTEEKRARWVELLMRSADEAGVPADPEFRSAFAAYIEWGTRLAVENSQPGAIPPQHMPVPHWDWGLAGAPGTRVSALAPAAEESEPEPELPAADETVGFEKHIKPLFRSRDRQSMKWAFDLWSFDDVRANATGILERVRNGTMPCDEAWPAEKVAVFERWADSPAP